MSPYLYGTADIRTQIIIPITRYRRRVRPNIKIFRRAGFGGGREQNDTAAETRTPPKFDPIFFFSVFLFLFPLSAVARDN